MLKHIKTKNALYLKSYDNITLFNDYKLYRNKLTTIIRAAKFNYHYTSQLLASFRNNSTKLWSHLRSLIDARNNNSKSVNTSTLNNFFTSVFKRASRFQCDQQQTLTNNSLINHNMIYIQLQIMKSLLSSLICPTQKLWALMA